MQKRICSHINHNRQLSNPILWVHFFGLELNSTKCIPKHSENWKNWWNKGGDPYGWPYDNDSFNRKWIGREIEKMNLQLYDPSKWNPRKPTVRWYFHLYLQVISLTWSIPCNQTWPKKLSFESAKIDFFSLSNYTILSH